MFLVLSLLIASCNFSSDMVNEIYVAHLNNKKNENHQNVDRVLAKYIYVGMETKSALSLLSDQGFDITEHAKLGYRDYPTGNLRPYADDDAVKRLEKDLVPADIAYSARRAKGMEWFTSNIIVSFKSKNNHVIHTKAYVSVD